MVLAMKGKGEALLSDKDMQIIKGFLADVPLKDYLSDIKYAPVWIQKKLQA